MCRAGARRDLRCPRRQGTQVAYLGTALPDIPERPHCAPSWPRKPAPAQRARSEPRNGQHALSWPLFRVCLSRAARSPCSSGDLGAALMHTGASGMKGGVEVRCRGRSRRESPGRPCHSPSTPPSSLPMSGTGTCSASRGTSCAHGLWGKGPGAGLGHGRPGSLVHAQGPWGGGLGRPVSKVGSPQDHTVGFSCYFKQGNNNPESRDFANLRTLRDLRENSLYISRHTALAGARSCWPGDWTGES